MRHALLLLVLLALSPAPVHAQIPLRKMGWGDSGELYQDLSPDCSSLPDQSKLVVSFVAPAGVANLQGVYGYVDFCTKPYAVPPWWTFSPYAGCRTDSLSARADFSAGPFSHTDPWGSRGQTTWSYEPSPGGDWSMSRIVVSVQATAGNAIPLQAGHEYYAFQIVFGNPDAGCGGCELPACFVLNGLLLYHDNLVEATEMDFHTNYCRWQGGQPDCPFIVPAQQTTWGRLKGIYR